MVKTADGSTKVRLPLRSGGFLWGPRRVAAGLSLRDIEEATGVYRGFVSRMENGVMIPTGEEFAAIMRVIEERERAVPPGVDAFSMTR